MRVHFGMNPLASPSQTLHFGGKRTTSTPPDEAFRPVEEDAAWAGPERAEMWEDAAVDAAVRGTQEDLAYEDRAAEERAGVEKDTERAWLFHDADEIVTGLFEDGRAILEKAIRAVSDLLGLETTPTAEPKPEIE